MDVILATNNKHKLKEMRSLLSNLCDNIFSLQDKNIVVEIEENGSTFEENSLLKAREISKLSGLIAIADDSGLCVDCLNGEPGVYSARYAGEPCDDEKNNEKLISKIKALEKLSPVSKSAKFISCVAAAFPDGRTFCVEGILSGEIIYNRSGTNGFGYDPYFYIPECKKTMADLDFDEKNKVSHRAVAFKKFSETFKKFIL